jgi:DNA-binding response OmpR family regulator
VRLASARELTLMLDAQALADEPTVGGAVVDLGGRGYDGVTAVEQVAGARLPVIAVAQHDDQLTRKRALGAGAQRVFSYQKFFTDGQHLVARWLAAGPAASPHAGGSG